MHAGPAARSTSCIPLPADVLNGQRKDGFTYPVAMYDHDEGQAVTDGFAYHGRIAALRGKFVFGDIQRGRLFAADLAAMKKADDGIPQTVAPVEEIQLYVRDANGNRTYVTLRELIEATNGATVTRADLHISRSRDGELFITSRQDGMIRMLVPDSSGTRDVGRPTLWVTVKYVCKEVGHVLQTGEHRLLPGCSWCRQAASAQQSASSGLVGQVTDSSQGAVPGATVTVTNVGTNAQRTTVTDGEGRFSVPALPPATYHIKVELQGFQTAELPNFVLRQGETARPTITLGVVTVSEAITVTGESPLLQTQSASVGQVISEKQIEEPAVERPQRAVAGVALGRRDAAQLRARHAVRAPQSVRHRRRRTRQLDQLHDRWRVCAVPAFQQSLAEPARSTPSRK